jgi:hypothetical protein
MKLASKPLQAQPLTKEERKGHMTHQTQATVLILVQDGP